MTVDTIDRTRRQSTLPSIFNDVIGPIMRGPSSSHCAASVRIGRLARDLMGGEIDRVQIRFDVHGSLATTHESQGSDMGLHGGLLGWEATDPRLVESTRTLREAGIKVETEIGDYGARHPNTYLLTLIHKDERHRLTAISTGGGMIQVTEIDGASVSIAGDYYETLIFVAGDPAPVADWLVVEPDIEVVHVAAGEGTRLVEVKSRAPLPETLLARIAAREAVTTVRTLAPVLPVLSRPQIAVPFLTTAEMMAYNAEARLPLWELAVRYESARGGLSEADVLDRMGEVVDVIRRAIDEGLAGTEYADRILGVQSAGFRAAWEAGELLDAGMLNRMILYVTALMEVKSAMGVIVAAPTAGACAGLPGAVVAAAAERDAPTEEMARALLAAGLIGVFIAARSTFAAEVAGCQAECGAGSGMAASALVSLAGGSAAQAVAAASMALQNILGMICDPVANRVEVPCLGRNVLAASNALACANMALAGYDPVIPLDQVIATMDAVGKSLPAELRCTALGGLSVTPASRAVEARLRGNDQ